MLGRISFVLDSYALIGYFENEPFSDRIQSVLTQAKRGDGRLFLHAIQMGEVYYITLREQGRQLADLVFASIKALPINRSERMDEAFLLEAAQLKASFPISYADSFAAALAIVNNCPILTGDPEFKILERNNVVAVEWLR